MGQFLLLGPSSVGVPKNEWQLGLPGPFTSVWRLSHVCQLYLTSLFHLLAQPGVGIGRNDRQVSLERPIRSVWQLSHIQLFRFQVRFSSWRHGESVSGRDSATSSIPVPSSLKRVKNSPVGSFSSD